MGETSKIEEKLKIDNDIIVLKRQYKLLLKSVEDTKDEYNQICEALDKKKELLEKYKEEFTSIINSISESKLRWTIEKDEEWQKIDNKKKEVDNILKRGSEQEQKEQELRKIEVRNTDILNETRRLELKVEQDKNILSSKEKELEIEKNKFRKEQENFSKEKEQFKDKIIKLSQEWQTK